VEITKLDVQAECLVITNNSHRTINLAGYQIRSVKSKLAFTFPKGNALYVAPGESVTIWSGEKNVGKDNPPRDIFWTRRSVWHNEGATARLLTPESKIISSFSASSMETIPATKDDEDKPVKKEREETIFVQTTFNELSSIPEYESVAKPILSEPMQEETLKTSEQQILAHPSSYEGLEVELSDVQDEQQQSEDQEEGEVQDQEENEEEADDELNLEVEEPEEEEQTKNECSIM